MYAADTIVLPSHKEKKELGAGTSHRRDWKGITTALVVISLICLLIFLCGYFFTPLHENEFDDSRQLLNLSDLSNFRSFLGVPTWLKDARLVFGNENGINLLGPGGNYTSILTYREVHDLLQRKASTECNFDCSMVSLSYPAENPGVNPDHESVVAYVLDVKSRNLSRVTADPKKPESIKYLLWSPNGKDYLFAQRGHLYYVAKPGDEPLDISTSSKSDTQLHGYFDWMTDEEIMDSRKAAWWSRNGSRLAFASHDGATEPAISLTAYRREEKYQIDTKLVYPKTGEKKLPVYSLSIWDKATGTLKQMDVQLRDSSAFHYLIAVSWIFIDGQEMLAATWANRWQNQTSLTICKFDSAMCSLAFEYSYPPKMWASPSDYQKMVAAKDSVFLILPRQMPDGNSYQHVARIKLNGSTKQFLSLGNFDVSKVVHHSESDDLLYFMTLAPQPTQQHLYVTKDIMSAKDTFHCVTCSLPNCTFVSVGLCPDGRRVTITCANLPYPRNYIAELKSGQLVNVEEVLHDSGLEKLMERTVLPTVIDDSFQLDNGIVATTRLRLPRSHSHTRALPLFVYVYGGPAINTICENFNSYLDGHAALVTNMGIAVLQIDARGANGRGWNYRSPMYGALGTIEMQDRIDVTRQVVKKYSYLDPTRVALFGWSYGGFATLRMVEMAPERTFRCAISGAPVTNFQYYDAAYTERYMGAAPKESYVDVSANKGGELAKFNSTRLLLIHGMSDDNVHFQNSAIFAETMQNNNIDFEFVVYPNERHSLSPMKKGSMRAKMAKFLRECLLK